MVTGLVDRIGPVVDEIRNVTARAGDPEGDAQKVIKNLNEAALALTSMGNGLRQLAADGGTLVRGFPERIDPLLTDARRSLARAESALSDAQRSLARTDAMLQRMDEALPAMIEDTRRSLQSARAASENLSRAIAEDMPRVIRRGETTLDDADEVIGGVRRAWPVRNLLSAPAEKVIELDSADGAEHVGAGRSGR